MSTEKKTYTVQPNHSVRAGGKSHRGGAGDASNVELGITDAQRLLDAGVILPAKKGDAADSKDRKATPDTAKSQK